LLGKLPGLPRLHGRWHGAYHGDFWNGGV